MADLELGDALKDPAPEIEPEIKRDFISSLEAEPYDDVIGETCDKTDYVPLLDDDDEAEPKHKLAEGGHAESPHAAVVANGEHGTGEIVVSEAAQGAFEDGWLTDSYSKTDMDTQGADTSEKTTATFGETPTDDSANIAFQVTQSDPHSDIWQPTAEEQLALCSHSPSEPGDLHPLQSEDFLFDAPVPQAATESQLLPGLADQQLHEPDTLDFEVSDEDPEYLSVDAQTFEAEKASFPDHKTVPEEPLEDPSKEVRIREAFSSSITDSPCLVHESLEDPIASEETAPVETQPQGETIEQEQVPPAFQANKEATPATHTQQDIPASTAALNEAEPLVSPVQIQEVTPADWIQESSEPPGSPTPRAEVEPPASPSAQTEAEPPASLVAETPVVEPPASPQADILISSKPEEVSVEETTLLTEHIPAEISPKVLQQTEEVSAIREDEPQQPEHPTETEKAAEPEPVEAEAGNDITAPPNKELPASPEKKVKATTATPSKAAASTPKGRVTPSPRKSFSATPGQARKLSSAAPAQTAGSTPKRALGVTVRTASFRETKDAKPKSPEKRTPTPVSTTPRPAVRANSISAGGTAPKSNNIPKRQPSVRNDVKPADTKKPTLTKSPTELSRPKAESKKPNGAAPTRPAAPRPVTGPSASADAKKVPTTRPTPLSKPSTAPASKPNAEPKQPRPAMAPDVKNIRSKIGSTDNLKYQPGGGKAKVEKKPVPASTARKPVPPAAPKPAASKPADTKEPAQKQSNGKVQIVSKKANYSHVQSKCGSKDNIKHVPGGGNVTNATKPSVGAARLPASSGHKPGSANVQILNKKIDVSKVSAKCGSKTGTKQKTGGADGKSEENSKKSEVTKQKPQDGTKENEVGQVAPSQNGDLVTPTEVTAADTRENGVEETLPVDGGNQRESQSFNALIPETSI